MANEVLEGEQITRYLLGRLLEDDLRSVEERLMRDNAFSDRVALVESSLVDDYVEDKLSRHDREDFERLFLSTPQGQDQVRFTQALKEYATRAAEPELMAGTRRSRGRSLWDTPRWALAAAAVLLVAVGVGTWRVFFLESELDKGLAALSRAYQRERPTEARITVLGYAPRPNSRGSQPEGVNSLSLRRAELALREGVEKEPGAASFHALGCLYLAEKDLDKAIENLEKALRLDPASAKIHSDLGVARLEKGKGLQQGNPTSAEEEFTKALEHLNKALELDPKLLAALFNRALLYQQTLRLNQAADDWREYLKKDEASFWADEVKTSIKAIENQK